MPRIYARITENQKKVIEEEAKKRGFIKKSGESNTSQYIRWLIDEKRTKK